MTDANLPVGWFIRYEAPEQHLCSPECAAKSEALPQVKTYSKG